MIGIRLDRGSLARFGPGDLLVIVLFVLIGELSHGALPWTVPQIVIETALTFIIGWVVVAPIAWAYQAENLTSTRPAVLTAVIAWVGASALANVIRATPLVHGNASITFFLVAVGAGGFMLAAWRWVWSLWIQS